MVEMVWLDHLPEGTLDSGMQLANRLYWNIYWWEHEGRWFVKGGESVLLRTDSRETAEAFLYGLGLAYSVLPPHLFEQLEAGVKDLV
jgi:hypothetical protein